MTCRNAAIQPPARVNAAQEELDRQGAATLRPPRGIRRLPALLGARRASVRQIAPEAGEAAISLSDQCPHPRLRCDRGPGLPVFHAAPCERGRVIAYSSAFGQLLEGQQVGRKKNGVS